MKSKAPLALMEQLIMVLFFSLAAVICLRIFITSDQLSRRSQARDEAVLLVQNAAEEIRHWKGDFDTALGELPIGYDADWQPCPAEQAVYWLTAVREETTIPHLGSAVVQLQTEEEEPLFALRVSWQEENHHA